MSRKLSRDVKLFAITKAANEHLQHGDFDAAIVMAWSAFESALYYFIADTQAPISAKPESRQTAWQLLSNLYSLGYISDEILIW